MQQGFRQQKGTEQIKKNEAEADGQQESQVQVKVTKEHLEVEAKTKVMFVYYDASNPLHVEFLHEVEVKQVFS